MIFLSAQPDDFYFSWQLEVQLTNFRNLGIPRNKIHVLIAFDPSRGLDKAFQDLMVGFRDYCLFFAYPDQRLQNSYLSSIRPHIIKQHFEHFPDLSDEVIFYHDSDIIFRELPHWERLCIDNTIYLSRTVDYLDVRYILSGADDQLLSAMSRVVGIPVETIYQYDQQVGGAQYLLKKVNTGFWEKVERDSEALFVLIEQYNDKRKSLGLNEAALQRATVDAWYADMWGVLWNLWLYGMNTATHPELDFCWAHNHTSEWHRTKILHYTGNIPKNDKLKFRKGNYCHHSPFFDSDIKMVSSETCGYQVVLEIEKIVGSSKGRRYDLRDVTFLIPLRIDSESRAENIDIICRYLTKYFDTNIMIMESDSVSKFDASFVNNEVKYFFDLNASPAFHRTKINNFLIGKAQTPFIVLYDTDVILPVDQIIDSVKILRDGDASLVLPYSGEFLSVDLLFKAIFAKILESDLLVMNKGKFKSSGERCCGGAVFLNKMDYLLAGMENEYFTSWGPEDIERVKRVKNLGMKVSRVPGSLYHLSHDRLENSSYGNGKRELFLEEYLKICDLDRTDLQEYIDGWPWVRKLPVANN
ncbi:hypothetical protein J2Y45_001825 [Dyadobacter sp. BE34]|jgi:hypothetical protein|uniref:Galactosyltransferase C-terminal domain-containing protein n=1 Tax=Dyadobacter fermentans TaxID=94254 RepID=A0ABU1QTQ8_9BACT|nr:MULTISPECIES: galactosyltransferase-related protein [Dyadobacter]MDR6804556.1 hypothetical protein [Dyadobacter fermentans]MDR7042296.1 hypothetical protein [Dyadobacter sp. BE242]MDR7196699.1 hypothetical protein [Dyadobacter sp. BE34]MDR7212756.1 hypothetical protein [Dyadobacter sp. BE31]MDR7262105.1 hypothetical protein [Dyadobacter sp. BE32]